ncbi:hypothetical protein GBA52_003971 [Prunus armeniaca]|nr:hypothetical protein GBA52_003971 [Prunus armeniaca]
MLRPQVVNRDAFIKNFSSLWKGLTSITFPETGERLIEFKYKYLPEYCFACGKLGHSLVSLIIVSAEQGGGKRRLCIDGSTGQAEETSLEGSPKSQSGILKLIVSTIVQDGPPNERKIVKLCEYAAKNPFRIPKIAKYREDRCYKELRLEHIKFINIVAEAYNRLLCLCKEHMGRCRFHFEELWSKDEECGVVIKNSRSPSAPYRLLHSATLILKTDEIW